MTIFHLTSNNHFILSADGKTISVLDVSKKLENGKTISWFDFSNPSDDVLAYMFLILRIDPVGVVGPDETYNGLEVFGVVIQGKKLEQLTNDLADSYCITNREGYCILFSESQKEKLPVPLVSSGNAFYRLNDLFIWSKYDVVPTITTVWNRRSMHDNYTMLVNYEELHDKLSRCELSLQQKEKEVRECKLKMTKLEKGLLKHADESIEQKKKETQHVKEELESKKKELSTIKNRLKEEEKVTKEKRKELEVCKWELEAKKKELLTWKKSINDKDKLLDSKNKELEVYKLRELEEKKKSAEYKNQDGSTAALAKELCECRKRLEEKDKELTRLRSKVLAKQGAVEALIVVLNNFNKQ